MSAGKTWVLVANGSRAKLIKYLDSQPDQEIINFDFEITGERLSDGIRRNFTLLPKSHSDLELHSDPVRNNERQFAKSVSAYLLDFYSSGQFDALIIAASARTLGDLRASFSAKLFDSITVELNKDYSQLPDKDLIKTFTTILKNYSLV